MGRHVAYISANDQYRRLFGRALKQVGFEHLAYARDLDTGLCHLEESDPGSLLVIHGQVPGIDVGDSLIDEIRIETDAPVILLGFEATVLGDKRDNVMVVPPPVTVAKLARAAAAMRQVPNSSLVQKLIQSRTFESFSADAVAFLLSRAKARQLKADEVLFETGDAGNSMYFVLVGSVTISIGDRILESVVPGGIFGEMAMLEGRSRSARAVAEGVTVLLEIDHHAIEDGDTDFRAVLFELITRTTIRRLRATNTSLVEADGARARTELEFATKKAQLAKLGGLRPKTVVDPRPAGHTDD